jgi:protein SCO1/2
MTANMAELYKLYEGSDKVHFLSVSVDPERDSLSVLQQYAKDHGVTDKRWLFARGELKDVANLLEKGFMLAADDLPTGHPSKFILVDNNGEIRGYYSGDDKSSIELLKNNIRDLARKM